MRATNLRKRGWDVTSYSRTTRDGRAVVVFLSTPPQEGRPVGDGDSGPQAEVIVAGQHMIGLPYRLGSSALRMAPERTAVELVVELNDMLDKYCARPTVRP